MHIHTHVSTNLLLVLALAAALPASATVINNELDTVVAKIDDLVESHAIPDQESTQ